MRHISLGFIVTLDIGRSKSEFHYLSHLIHAHMLTKNANIFFNFVPRSEYTIEREPQTTLLNVAVKETRVSLETHILKFSIYYTVIYIVPPETFLETES